MDSIYVHGTHTKKQNKICKQITGSSISTSAWDTDLAKQILTMSEVQRQLPILYGEVHYYTISTSRMFHTWRRDQMNAVSPNSRDVEIHLRVWVQSLG